MVVVLCVTIENRTIYNTTACGMNSGRKKRAPKTRNKRETELNIDPTTY